MHCAVVSAPGDPGWPGIRAEDGPLQAHMARTPVSTDRQANTAMLRIWRAAAAAGLAVILAGCSAVVSSTTGRMANSLSEALVNQNDPETVRQDLIVPTLRVLYDLISTERVVLMCPWGKYLNEKGEPIPGGNISAVYPEDLLMEGYAVVATGQKDRAGSNLLAWKQKRSHE